MMKNFLIKIENLVSEDLVPLNGLFITQEESIINVSNLLKNKWIYDIVIENPDKYPELFTKMQSATQYQFKTPINIDQSTIQELLDTEKDIELNDLTIE